MPLDKVVETSSLYLCLWEDCVDDKVTELLMLVFESKNVLSRYWHLSVTGLRRNQGFLENFWTKRSVFLEVFVRSIACAKMIRFNDLASVEEKIPGSDSTVTIWDFLKQWVYPFLIV